MNKKIVSIIVALIFVLGFAGIALANSGAYNAFLAQYPATTLTSCTTCHPPSGPPGERAQERF